MDAFDLMSDFEDDQPLETTLNPVNQVEITKSTEATSLEKLSKDDLTKNGQKLPFKRNFSEMEANSKENSSRKRLLRLYSEESAS